MAEAIRPLQGDTQLNDTNLDASGAKPEDSTSSGVLLSLAAIGTTALALLSAWIVALLLWPRMPNYMPFDLGADGMHARWDETTALAWFWPPIRATLLAACVVFSERIMMFVLRRRPALLPVPRKAEFIALPVETRSEALAPLRSMMWGLGGPYGLLCVHDLIVTYDFATGRGGPLFTWWIVSLTAAGYAVAWIVCCLAMQRKFVLDAVSGGQSSSREPS